MQQTDSEPADFSRHCRNSIAAHRGHFGRDRQFDPLVVSQVGPVDFFDAFENRTKIVQTGTAPGIWRFHVFSGGDYLPIRVVRRKPDFHARWDTASHVMRGQRSTMCGRAAALSPNLRHDFQECRRKKRQEIFSCLRRAAAVPEDGGSRANREECCGDVSSPTCGAIVAGNLGRLQTRLRRRIDFPKC